MSGKVVPQKFAERIQFYLDHIAPFTANATAIGITTTEVTDLETKSEAAQTALAARSAALQAAEAKTTELHNALDAMSIAGAALIEKIRAKAKQVGGDSVYALAQLPPPATPSSVGNPGTPETLSVVLNSGELMLKWKAKNPVGCTGVMYQVWRKCDAGSFEYLGGCGTKSFIDTTVPAGTTNITYKIQGVRSTAVGLWGEFNVSFGGNGETVTVTAQPKMAA